MASTILRSYQVQKERRNRAKVVQAASEQQFTERLNHQKNQKRQQHRKEVEDKNKYKPTIIAAKQL